MKKASQLIIVALVVLVGVSLAAELSAQFEKQQSVKPKSSKTEEVPRAALLTERGRQLADELRMLKRSRDSMGSRHPTLPLINQKIAAIKEQLEAWEPAFGEPEANPFHSDSQSATPMLNEYDLRQMVIKLNRRVEMLEKRVSELEKK